MADFVIKLVLLGDAGVGKTSLVYRFIENRFSRDFKSTLGVNLLKKKVHLETKVNNIVNALDVSCQVWDLGGQEAYRKLRKLYLEGSQGALIVFDVLNQKSFDNLDDWVQSFIEIRGKNNPMILIANKIDMEEHRVIKRPQAEEYAKRYNMKLIETSAATGTNVETAFNELIKQIVESVQKTPQT